MGGPPSVMSYLGAKVATMDEEAESAARLAGLLAMLALPMLRRSDGSERRRCIEIEIKEGIWARIESATVEMHRLIFSCGSNGTRVQYEFRASEGCPRWRADKPEPRHYATEEDHSRRALSMRRNG